MRVRDSSVALTSWRALNSSISRADRSMARLSSGRRVNSAADDAASLGMSQRIRGQVMGLVQANRNALDGLSLLQTAEGAMHEIHSLLQRGRELAVQASNGTLTTADRESMQTELDHILLEIDRISDTTTFNDLRLLNPTGTSGVVSRTIAGLRSGWLEQAEQVVETYYGIVGDSSPLQVVLEASGSHSVRLDSDPDVGGMRKNLRLRINLAQFMDVGSADGGPGPMHYDRLIARALTQAVLVRNSNFSTLDPWFISGVSDYIAGADEELAQVLATTPVATVVNAISTPWLDDSLHRASAYLAVKYLHGQLQGFGLEMTDFMSQLAGGNSLDDALLYTTGLSDVPSFLMDFQANAPALVGTLWDFSDSDVGGIHPGDARAVIPNGATTPAGLANFTVEWPTGVLNAQPMRYTFQVGANEGEMLEVELPEITTANLDLIGVNLVGGAEAAITKLNTAINMVAAARGKLGGVANRLERVLNVNALGRESQSASFSRMVDLDYAQEVSTLTREQILLSAASAASAHANSLRGKVQSLLEGLERFRYR